MLGGISVASNMDLDPYLVRFPSLGFSGGVTSPSTLDVYVNDTLVRSVPVAPGEFEVTNLPPASGAGSTRYVLRDALGHERAVQSDYYAPRGLLAPGLHDYAYAFGAVRESFGSASLDYGGPALIARHRYGFTEKVTAGARLEVDDDQASGGVGIALAPGRGELEVEASASATWDGQSGAAGLVGYSYRGQKLAMATMVRVASPRYTTMSLGANDDRRIFEHTTSASWAFSSWGSVATRAIYSLGRERDGLDARFDVSLTSRITTHLNLIVSAMARCGSVGPSQEEVTATLRVFLPAHHSASLGTRIGSGGERDASAQISRPITGRYGVGYQVGGSVGTHDTVDAAVRARTRYGRLDASYVNLGGDQHFMVRGAAGVAFVPGAGLFFRGPIEQAYAVVRVGEVEGVRVYMNNQEIGRTDSRGRLFVPGLLAYQANRLRVEMADLPMDHALADDEQIVAPTDRGAARVAFDAHAIRIVRGRVATDARYGELDVTAPRQHRVSPIGVGGEFELIDIAPGVWPAVIRSPEGECALTLVVPEGDEPIVDLGVLSCTDAPVETSP
jgi:outer membrane usher protein